MRYLLEVCLFLDAKLNALVVTQGYYLEGAPVTYL